MVKVGLRANNFPNEDEKQLLLAHIITEYGNHTPKEIQLAFDMAIAGKLGLKEVSCYENFSCLYFSNVMNAYREWAKETYKLLKKDQPKMIEEKIELTTEEKQEWINEWRNNDKREFLLIPIIFYDYLNLSDYEQYLEKSMVYCKKEIMMHNELQSIKDRKLVEFVRQEKDGFEGEYKGRIVNMAKRISINNYFKQSECLKA